MFSARANIPIQLSSSKFQTAGYARVPGFRLQVPGQGGDLEFGICLEFGIWNLEFQPVFRLLSAV
jgi:hypothetical protein